MAFGLGKDIGMDLGTANTLVFMRGKGIILQEPSVVAIHARTREMLAVGAEAKAMIGRTPSDIIAVRPLRQGVIADFDAAKMLIKYFIKKAMNRGGFVRPRVLVSIPLGITQVEKKAVIDAAIEGGAREAYLIEEPIAAAIGAGLPVQEPVGRMIVDVGGGTSEIAIISLGGVVLGKSLRVGGDAMNEAIARYLKKNYNLAIGERTSEDIKIKIGYATDASPNEKITVRGRNLATGLPTSIEVSAVEVSEALQEPLSSLVEAIKLTLELTPPELAADILDTGITLSGGGALLKNLDTLIARETKIPVKVADDPLTCVARGAGQALEHIKALKRVEEKK